MTRDQKTVYCDTGLALGLPSERRSCLSAYRYTMGSPLEPSLTLSLSGSAEAEGSNQSNRKSCDDTEAEEEGGGSARKKLRLSKEQSALLEGRFKEHHTLNPKQKHALAKQLNLRPRQVEVWFQNRRARTKLKQTEVECEFLKRCCQTLIGENQRLQRELNELKFAPRPYMQQPPPVCPSCQKIAGDDGRKGGAVVVRSKPVLLNAFTRPAAC